MNERFMNLDYYGDSEALLASFPDEVISTIQRYFEDEIWPDTAPPISQIVAVMEQCRERISDCCSEEGDPVLRHQLETAYHAVGVLCTILQSKDTPVTNQLMMARRGYRTISC